MCTAHVRAQKVKVEHRVYSIYKYFVHSHVQTYVLYIKMIIIWMLWFVISVFFVSVCSALIIIVVFYFFCCHLLFNWSVWNSNWIFSHGSLVLALFVTFEGRWSVRKLAFTPESDCPPLIKIRITLINEQRDKVLNHLLPEKPYTSSSLGRIVWNV